MESGWRFHKDGTLPQNGEVFVFGSNLAGIHGAGAAAVAYEKFGAEWGIGVGKHGQSYAIPTKNRKIYTLDLQTIRVFVDEFVHRTHEMSDTPTRWFVTRVGCGLANYKDQQIAPMFKGAINCSFAEQWKEYLK